MGTLYVVATPIGNLEDITIRAIKTLKEVNYIACEDTRQARKLLNYYGIQKKHLISYYDYNEDNSANKIIKILEKEDVALISDAGTPTISDPGYNVVKLAIEKGFKVSPIPGPSALVSAISVSGLPTDKFLFYGFLPNKELKRRQELERLFEIGITFVLYESPKRVLKTLEEISSISGNSYVFLAKEITKINEFFIKSTAKDVLSFFKEHKDKLKGEFVIIVYPEKDNEVNIELLKEEITHLLQKGIKIKQISKQLSEKYNIPKNKIYNITLQLKDS